MRALILVGGFGTRLRPLTTNYPKSVVPFAGRPMVEWQIEALVKVGVTKIVLAICYKEELMKDFIAEMNKKYKIDITCSIEKEPLNTGGPLKLAEKLLVDESNAHIDKSTKTLDNMFFVLNSDIICQYPFKNLIEFHMAHKGRATILCHEVEEPSRFGVIIHDKETGLVKSFVEKPQIYVGNSINAGIYIFNNSVLDDIELRSVSMEREIFPMLAHANELYVMKLEGFWKDIGLPADFLVCNKIYLNYFEEINRLNIDDFELKVDVDNFKGINLIHKQAKISSMAVVGPFCVIHKNVKIGDNCRIAESILMDDSVVDDNAHIFESILMFEVKVGKWARLDKQTILAERVSVRDESLLVGERVEPNQVVGKSK